MSTAFRIHTNWAVAQLAAAHAPGDGTLHLATGGGAAFGSPSASNPIAVTLAAHGTAFTPGMNGTNATIFACTAVAGDVLTVAVAEGTTDRAYVAGDYAFCAPTAADMAAVQSAVNALESAVAGLEPVAYGGSWDWTTSLTAAGSGRVGMNAATWGGASQININGTTSDNRDMTQTFAALLVLDNELLVQEEADSTQFGRYLITGPAVQMGGGLWNVPVSALATGGSPPNNNVNMLVMALVQGGGGGTPPGGSNGQVQYNSSNAFAGSAGLTWNDATGVLAASQFSGNGSALTSLNAGMLASGTVPIGRLGASGTPSGTTYLRGDNSWATPATGGGSVTSVGLTMPGGFTVANSPVTAAGTLAVTTALAGILQANAGAFSTITIGSGLSFTGGVLSATAGGGGTVTSVSVVTANGFAGSVATPSTLPAITISTTVTGLLKGNGTSVTAAVAGTDYLVTAGANTQVIYNAAGALAGSANLTWTASTNTLAINLGTITTAATALAITGTWNAIANLGPALLVNITATQSGLGSLLMDLQQAGTSQFKVGASGMVNAGGSITAASFVGVGSALTSLNAANISSGTIAAARLPTTGLTITQHAGAINPATDGATITFDLSLADWQSVTLGGNRTLAPSNVAVGQQFTLILTQDGTGSRTVTWFSGIKWPGGTVPTLSTAAGKVDVFTFKCTAAGAYLGFAAGLGMS